MYAVAARLDPDNYHELARATFAEMALAGIGVIGEFHYVHHQPDGTPYAETNVMGEAVIAAARDVGVRLTLLDTVYLHGGFARTGEDRHRDLEPGQLRFGDGSADRFIDRAARAEGDVSPGVRLGAAVHSVRAVDPHSMAAVACWAAEVQRPLHIHVSEQPTENEECRRVYGGSPVELLDRSGVLSPNTTLVHGTHVGRDDIGVIAGSGAGCCFCPTTERDLADGIGPSRSLAEAGVALSLGTDSQACIDVLGEVQALAHHDRLASLERGGHSAPELLSMATGAGYDALGWPGGGELAVGGLADFTTVGLGSVRLAGAEPESLLASVAFAATGADVTHTIVGGDLIVADGRHHEIDVPDLLRRSIRAVTA